MFQLLAPILGSALGIGGTAAAGAGAAGLGSSLLSGMASSALMGGIGSLLGGGGGGGGGGAGIPSSMTGMAVGQAPQMRPAMNLSPSPQFADGGLADYLNIQGGGSFGPVEGGVAGGGGGRFGVSAPMFGGVVDAGLSGDISGYDIGQYSGIDPSLSGADLSYSRDGRSYGASYSQSPQMDGGTDRSYMLNYSMPFADGGVMDMPQSTGKEDIVSAVAAAGLPTDQRTLGLVAMLVDKGASVEQAITLLLQKESGVSNIPAPPPGEAPEMASAMDRGGMIRGPGTGVQDLIEGTIDNRQKVLLSDGEFVVPARVVSALGDGSSEAGAKVLHGMMDRVKSDAAKNLKTNGEIDTRKVLPA